MARSDHVKLSPTSYAILGQLAWGEASTYELTKAMRRNLRYFWPRAEARIYDEAKRLAAAGLATATRGRTGRRPRTVYAISERGRSALRAWLETAPERVSLEHGPLLRVFLGREGDPEDLRRAIAAARTEAEAMLEVGRPLGEEYLERRHPQQHEVHLRALTFDYLYGWALFTRDWADRAAAEVARWEDTEPDAGKQRRALARIRDRLRS
ncbi:MAG TPA: helix-turn-helix transcriptional regulator [Thermoleophilaceae bacterium]|nr:helix-turn-helix transcriptional regulator [Thermoleophilaceae bacterium]